MLFLRTCQHCFHYSFSLLYWNASAVEAEQETCVRQTDFTYVRFLRLTGCEVLKVQMQRIRNTDPLNIIL